VISEPENLVQLDWVPPRTRDFIIGRGNCLYRLLEVNRDCIENARLPPSIFYVTSAVCNISGPSCRSKLVAFMRAAEIAFPSCVLYVGALRTCHALLNFVNGLLLETVSFDEKPSMT
jgi:hypothetical protein